MKHKVDRKKLEKAARPPRLLKGEARERFLQVYVELSMRRFQRPLPGNPLDEDRIRHLARLVMQAATLVDDRNYEDMLAEAAGLPMKTRELQRKFLTEHGSVLGMLAKAVRASDQLFDDLNGGPSNEQDGMVIPFTGYEAQG